MNCDINSVSQLVRRFIRFSGESSVKFEAETTKTHWNLMKLFTKAFLNVHAQKLDVRVQFATCLLAGFHILLKK